MTTRAKRQIVLIALLVLFVACDESDRLQGPGIAGCELATEAVPADPSTPSEVPLRLVACALDTEVEPGGPVPVFVAIQNIGPSGGSAVVRLELDHGLGEAVTGPDGRELEPLSPLPDSYLRDQTFFPYGGVFGRVIDLRCYYTDIAGGEFPVCYPLYEFREPGTYRIVFSAHGFWCVAATCDPSTEQVFSLESNPVEVRVVGAP